MAYEREWPDKQFIKEVEEAFPDQGIANVEEGRVRNVVGALGACICDVTCMCRKHIAITSIMLYTCCEYFIQDNVIVSGADFKSGLEVS